MSNVSAIVHQQLFTPNKSAQDNKLEMKVVPVILSKVWYYLQEE